MKRFHESSEKLHNVLYFLSGAMAVILVLIIVVGVQTKAQNGGYDTNENGASDVQEPAQVAGTVKQSTEKPEKWQEGTVTYKGKDYRYNSNLRVFLMMGIDNDDPVATASDYTNGGQSDAMFLLVVDSLNQKLQVISINRNTMTDIKLCDQEGYSMGTIQGQICLQHAFGDAKRISCQRSVDAVADLFGNIPISGYLAMNMGAIPTMNDAVGGVKVKVLQNISYPDYNVKLHKGDKVTLNGQEAYYYLRGRDVRKYDSASDRLRREEQSKTKTLKLSTKSSAVTISWGKVARSSGYAVYRYDSKTKKYVRIATVKSGKTVTYKDAKLKKGSTKHNKVRAYKTYNGTKYYGAYSDIVSIKVK